MATSYRELIVWQRSIELSVALYAMSRSFPREEVYGLTSQLRRAGVAVASNIAEGWGRGSRPDYRHFLCIARGSALEIQTQLVIVRELGYGEPNAVSRAEELATVVGKMLWTMVARLDERSGKSSG
ncbi:MAG: four helix bundle protein [Acidobacteriota bacterium]